MAGEYGVTQRLAFGPTATLTREVTFQSESLKGTDEFVNLNGMRGTRDENIERSVLIRHRVGGAVNLVPTALEMAFLMQYVMGGTPSGTSYPLAEVLPTFFAGKVDGLALFSYANLGVNRCVIRGATGGGVGMDLDLIGKSETVTAGGALPGGLSPDATTGVFIMPQAALTIGIWTFEVNSFTLTIDNMIDADRFHGSTNLTEVNAQNRQISFEAVLPWGSVLHGTPLSTLMPQGPAGLAATLTLTNGTVSAIFATGAFQFAKDTPVASARTGEKLVTLRGRWFRTGATASITTTIDSTP